MPRRTPPGTPAPADFTYADVMALKALADGNANEGQQKRALDWIVNKACRRYADAYSPDQLETDFNLGRVRVGISITDLINMPGHLVDKLRKEHG